MRGEQIAGVNHLLTMLESKVCYIRRANSPWVRGKRHHEVALHSYITLYVSPLDPGQIPSGNYICADHENGGKFYAYFSWVGDYMYQFLDEYGNNVYIMMEQPERIAYINRIVDSE